MHARYDTASGSIAPFFRIGGTNYDGTSSNVISNTYSPIYLKTYNSNPYTIEVWAKSEISGAELGIIKTG
jgi:lysine/ornithine N-monooxygenase